jgi:hypothetical protein
VSFFIFYFFIYKIREQEVGTGSGEVGRSRHQCEWGSGMERVGGEYGANTVYTYK